MNTSKTSEKTTIKQEERTIYSLEVADLQTVANEELGRNLTEKEIKLVEEEVGGYIDWYTAIHLAIIEVIL